MGARFFDVRYRFTYLRSMGAEKNPRLLSQTYQPTCSNFLSDIVYLIYIYTYSKQEKSLEESSTEVGHAGSIVLVTI